MNKSEKLAKLIVQLLRATYAGEVAWTAGPAPAGLTKGTDDIIPIYLATEYKGADLGVYERRYKYWVDEDSFHWSSAIHFVVVRAGLYTQYSEFSPALNELFEAAQESASDIDDLLNNLLE